MENLSFATREITAGSGIIILRVEGSLDVNTVVQFEARLQELVLDRKLKIIVNMENLSYISSAGIGVLVYFNQFLRNNQGNIILTHVNKATLRIFELLELPRIFQLMNTEQDALNEFEGNRRASSLRLNPVRLFEGSNA